MTKVGANRGAKPGEKRGGRQAGTPNKRTLDVIAKLESLDCDPVQGMASVASQAMEKGDLQLAGNMYKELAQYVAPKRRAVELTSEVEAIQPVINVILAGK